MSSGDMIVSDKLQFPANGNEMIHQHYQTHRLQFFHLDERDGFISWIRGEFAAANAMIDTLCHHLRSVGDPGEYESVIGIIQQRRCNWNQVLHMQQYFSVADVSFGLQQVAMRKMQPQNRQLNPRYSYDQSKFVNANLRRSNGTYSYNRNKSGDPVKEVVYFEKSEEVTSVYSSEKLSKNSTIQGEDIKEGVSNENSEAMITQQNDNSLENESGLCTDDCKIDKPDICIAPTIFNAPELIDGHQVNVVQGLKLYEHLLSSSKVSNLVSLVNDLRAAGKNNQFLGQTYVVARRPTRGHGREIIQFGIPVVDSSADEEDSTLSKDKKVESIPALLQDVIDCISANNLTSLKPDCCIIDIYNEGDHSQPHLWPPSYGKSVFTLTLTECDMIFGRVIVSDHPGDYKGSLKLSLAPGSLLIMEGKSSDFARHALPSIPKQRLLVTFIKTHLKKSTPGESGHRYSTTSSSSWIPAFRSPNHVRHSAASRPGNHFTAVSPIRSPISSPNGPHLCAHGPGTGVFLPPSGSALGASDGSGSTETERNGEDAPSKEQIEDNNQNLDCNGTVKVEAEEQNGNDY